MNWCMLYDEGNLTLQIICFCLAEELYPCSSDTILHRRVLGKIWNAWKEHNIIHLIFHFHKYEVSFFKQKKCYADFFGCTHYYFVNLYSLQPSDVLRINVIRSNNINVRNLALFCTKNMYYVWTVLQLSSNESESNKSQLNQQICSWYRTFVTSSSWKVDILQ